MNVGVWQWATKGLRQVIKPTLLKKIKMKIKTSLLPQFVEMAHYTFLCGQDTVFDQSQLSCSMPRDAWPCADSVAIYEESNKDVGKEPVKKEEEATVVVV